MELGIKEIDQHHRKLVDLINLGYDSHFSNQPEDTIQQIIIELSDYAFIHFRFEEKHFVKFGYEDMEAHINEHVFFTDKIKRLRFDWVHGTELKKQEVVDFLKKWLEHHILNIDKKYH